jgi:hypothetical protein
MTMSLKVISAGVGRTGTFSVKQALETLGLGPCHHMEEVNAESPEEVLRWRKAVNGTADWPLLYDGYRSAVDWPTAAFWRELSVAYPDAKVLLTVRDPESWYKSFSGTISPLVEAHARARYELKPFLEMVSEVLYKTGFRIPSDKDDLIAAFNRHNQAVHEAIPPDRLLIYDVKQGWGPLCDFLGVPVPSTAFPQTNSKDDFWASAQELKPTNLG